VFFFQFIFLISLFFVNHCRWLLKNIWGWNWILILFLFFFWFASDRLPSRFIKFKALLRKALLRVRLTILALWSICKINRTCKALAKFCSWSLLNWNFCAVYQSFLIWSIKTHLKNFLILKWCNLLITFVIINYINLRYRIIGVL